MKPWLCTTRACGPLATAASEAGAAVVPVSAGYQTSTVSARASLPS